MSRRRSGLPAFLLVLAAGLTSCAVPPGGSDAPSAGASLLDVTSIDPCAILDVETLAAELGQRVSAGEVENDAAHGTATCRYPLLSGLAALSIVLDRSPASGVGGEAILESLGPLPGLEELHGVGDVAWFGYCPACPAKATTTLTVIAAPLTFTIAFEGAAPPTAEKLYAESLARKVVDELGL